MDPTPDKGFFQRLTTDAYRFILVGCAAYATDFLVFTWLTAGLGFIPQTAQPINRLCGGLVSFTLNKFWTFRHNGQITKVRTQFTRYWITWLGTLILSEIFLTVFHNLLHLHEGLAKILADGLTGLLSFFVQRHWTFR